MYSPLGTHPSYPLQVSIMPTTPPTTIFFFFFFCCNSYSWETFDRDVQTSGSDQFCLQPILSRRKHFQRCLSRGSVISDSNTAPSTTCSESSGCAVSHGIYGDCPLLSCINARPKQTTCKYFKVRLSTNFSSATLLQLLTTTTTVKLLRVLWYFNI